MANRYSSLKVANSFCGFGLLKTLRLCLFDSPIKSNISIPFAKVNSLNIDGKFIKSNPTYLLPQFFFRRDDPICFLFFQPGLRKFMDPPCFFGSKNHGFHHLFSPTSGGINLPDSLLVKVAEWQSQHFSQLENLRGPN